MAGAVAARARQVGRFTKRRFEALARQFHQAEARDLAELHAGAIQLHRITQFVFHLTLMLGRLHVDEVDDHQATQVAQAQLAGNFFGRFKVGVEGGCLDVAALVARAELTSMETSASVWSITMAPPDGRLTVRLKALSIWCSIWKREKSGTSSW